MSRGGHNRIDMTGRVFGRLTVTEFSHTKKTKSGSCAMWEARCDCGTVKVYRGANLRNGSTSSCGCLNKERSAEAARLTHTTQGMTNTPTWKSWKSMHDRCLLASHKDYDRYRHITICDRWLNNFEAFFADMGERPDGTTLERIDNEGHYSPDNCRWATHKEQARNRRNGAFVTHNGQSKTLAEWSEILGVRPSTLWRRLKRGMPAEKALTASSFKKGQALLPMENAARGID